MKTRPWIASSLLAGLVLLAACQVCNDDGCNEGLFIEVTEPSRAPIEDGTYEVIFGPAGSEQSAVCVVSDEGHDASCDGLEGVLSMVIYDSPDNPYEEFHFQFGEVVEGEVRLQMTHDGGVVLDEVWEPAYGEREPECKPGCLQAFDEFELAR